jgi:uncharacterized protein with GYD domain
MAKFLIQASYTADGARGLLKEGGSKRRQAAESAIKSVGGIMEAFYFALGDDDAYVIVDAPDYATIAGASIAINASGAVTTKTVALLSPEDIDNAVKKTVNYRAPGR